ncbi:hypothetical protein [Pectobacterium sp. 21LCBS03]|uniref:hypothetical protein n=1 Tax=Pectobacterium sp. 21LCBS03 TaxID=2935858 RepID=UPI00200CCBEA|nr:hypothetical protein [Pectobacterium sp. 21LCBS03]UPY93604.1 hypothetical protein MYB54_13440 [Pectobacterium sp. 21LCBS03]
MTNSFLTANPFSLVLPVHIRIQPIITLDQAALIMAGVDDGIDSVHEAENGNFEGWKEAKAYKKAILGAVRLGMLKPLTAVYYPENSSYEANVDVNSINVNTCIDWAEFAADVIWPWADTVLSGCSIAKKNSQAIDAEPIMPLSPIIYQESFESIENLKNKITELEIDIQKLKKLIPCHIGSFVGGADKDPLFQAIRIRNNEWQSYDPNDKSTKASQESIILDLRNNYGFVDSTAKAIEKVACPIDRNPSKIA